MILITVECILLRMFDLIVKQSNLYAIQANSNFRIDRNKRKSALKLF